MSDLPKTFPNAVYIMRHLGVRYIWIDSLCIMQDDPKGWKAEASAIGQLYRNAFLIVATSEPTNEESRCSQQRSSHEYVSPASISMGY